MESLRNYENRGGVKNGSWVQRKAALLYFVMATQALYICYSFYQALDISNQKSSLTCKIFFNCQYTVSEKLP